MWLQEHRGVSFQDMASCILSDGMVDMIENPSRDGQEAFVVRFRGYIWVVSFVVEKDDSIFLKDRVSQQEDERTVWRLP